MRLLINLPTDLFEQPTNYLTNQPNVRPTNRPTDRPTDQRTNRQISTTKTCPQNMYMYLGIQDVQCKNYASSKTRPQTFMCLLTDRWTDGHTHTHTHERPTDQQNDRHTNLHGSDISHSHISKSKMMSDGYLGYVKDASVVMHVPDNDIK